ncbi:hypothetical protein DH2020_038083 [Rehmannia glutinosa]|uniref:RING-type domain-containing protein n=1 Tax=Rehmannia glutinosa TaxID=99300 RepID=A0ABR0UZY2_REHGL
MPPALASSSQTLDPEANKEKPCSQRSVGERGAGDRKPWNLWSPVMVMGDGMLTGGLEGIDDVQGLPSLDEGEGSSMSWENTSHIHNLMHMGKKASHSSRFDQAIEFYSRADKIRPGDPTILSNRCATYLKLSEFLKDSPPSFSEKRPLYGLDPTTHAGLALKDAEKVMSLQSNSITSHILKSNALILLEKYEQAWDVICSGLQIDPQSKHLLNLEKLIANTCIRRSHVKPQRTDDYDCTVCLKLLHEPVTTPCGHSFCRSCLFQSMDRGNRCPLCRTVLLISPRTCSISVTLNNIIQKNFPEEFEERKSEHDSLINLGVDLLPLFVKDVILPCQKFQLNIFEPRDRLMILVSHLVNLLPLLSDLKSHADCVETGEEDNGRKSTHGNGSIADYACEVEITDCEPLPDGRFSLEITRGLVVLYSIWNHIDSLATVESRRRCRIIQNWDQDGYHIAEVEWVQDISPPEGSTERNDVNANFTSNNLILTVQVFLAFLSLLEMTNKAAAFARQLMRKAQYGSQAGRIRLEELATLTNRSPSERLDLLRIRDTKEDMMEYCRDFGVIYRKPSVGHISMPSNNETFRVTCLDLTSHNNHLNASKRDAAYN